MSEKVITELIPVPEQVITAAPESVIESPEEKLVETSKTFTQEEMDAAIGKRLAREQRRWERERQLATPVPVNVPPADQFDTVEAYAEARAIALVEQRDQQRQHSEIIESYHEREEEARGKYDDFEQVAYNPKLPVTDVMAQTIQSSDIGPDIAYFLGSNPKEAKRIAVLPPFLQAKEIGRIEAKLADSPPVKKSSNAPAPFVPVTARSSGAPAFDTTDPRSDKTMNASQWIEADRVRQRKKLEAQYNR
jgi:hypothetical protein